MDKMSEENRILGVIPVGGGSKGIPKKNIKPLAGEPLIAHTIKEAEKSEYLDKYVVSTDDEEIAKVANNYCVEVVERPKELVRDDSPSIDVILYVGN